MPIFFPPVYFDVEIDGRKYREMHADGGVVSSVFLYPYMLRLDPDNLASRIGSKLYIICSGKLCPDPGTVDPGFSSIALNAVTSLLYASASKEIEGLYSLSLLTGMEFNLQAIPQDFASNPNSLAFDPQDMQKLFELGYQAGQSDTSWRKVPPEFEQQDRSLPRTGLRFATTDTSSR